MIPEIASYMIPERAGYMIPEKAGYMIPEIQVIISLRRSHYHQLPEIKLSSDQIYANI